MALPTLITVHGKFTKPDGSPEQGVITFKSSVYSLDSGSDTVLVPGTVPGYLDATGSITLTLPATNDPAWTPAGWTYTLIAQFTSAFYSYDVVIPYDAPNHSISFSALVPAASSTNNQLYAAYNHTHQGFLTEANIDEAVTDAVGPAVTEALGGTLSNYATINQLTAKANTSSLAPVAFTGSYTDLTNKPTIGDSPVNSVAGKVGDVVLTKSDVGLSNVDNTSDLNKPVSTAQQTALNAKANTSSLAPVATSGSYTDLTNKPTIPTIPVTSVASRTGDVVLTKSDVGLSNVDNTSDANKPVSSATQTALNGKANTSHTHTQAQITDLTFPVVSVAGKTGTVTLTKSDVGLSNVDNTSDANKPISTATQTALDAKLAKAGGTVTGDLTLAGITTFTGTTSGINYNDLTNKPSSTGGSGTSVKIVRANITSGSFSLANSPSAWATLPGGPVLQIDAAVGDNVECYVGCLLDCNTGASDWFELASLSSDGTTIGRFASTNSSTPAGANEGDPAAYPANAGQRFRNMSVTMSFTVTSSDLIAGKVNFVMTSYGIGAGKVFAEPNYPFRWRAVNFGA